MSELVALEGSRFSKAIGLEAGKTARVGELTLLLKRVHRVPWPPGNPPPHLDVFRYRLDGDRGHDDGADGDAGPADAGRPDSGGGADDAADPANAGEPDDAADPADA